MIRRVPIIFFALGLLLWLGGCESRHDYDNRAEQMMRNPPPAEPDPYNPRGIEEPVEWKVVNGHLAYSGDETILTFRKSDLCPEQNP